MDRPIDVEAVVAGKPGVGTLLRRGFTKRCPRCGSGGIYEGWFRMRPRCPSCGYLFEREPGFFVGAYLINFAIAEGFLFLLCMVFLVWKVNHPEAGLVVPLIIGLVIGIAAPVVFYPFARTIWSAIDLAMTPLELTEIVAAADHVAPEGGTEGGDPVDDVASTTPADDTDTDGDPGAPPA